MENVRSPTRPSKPESRRSMLPRGIFPNRSKLERKDSGPDLSESTGNDKIYDEKDRQYLQDSNRSLGDVEFAFESPTARSPSKTKGGGTMRKRTNLDASITSAAAFQASELDQSGSRLQMSSGSMLLNPPPLTEVDETMEKSHHKPQHGTKRGGGAISSFKYQGKYREVFLLRLSVIVLLTGCVFLSYKHYRLLHGVETGANLARDLSANPEGVTGGANVLQPNPQARIIGGTSLVDLKEYPWFVLFRGSSICGGVLIASDLVMSAAHCFGAGNPGDGENYVYLNTASQTADGLDHADKVEIEEERRHDKYVDGIYAYDIMLVKLKSKKKDGNRKWIRMNLHNPSLPQANDELSVLGFGDIDMNENSVVVPEKLQIVTVNAIDYKYCWTLYEAGAVALRDAGMEAQELTPDQMCAEQTNAGTCAGDSGGPLFIKGKEGADDLLVGTVAWHRGGCGNNFFPDVYSNVTWFADWIISNACEMASDPSHLPC